MTTKHTPGPWEINLDDSSNPIIGADKQVVARVAHLAAWRHPLEAEANARLIASAPAMLAALEKAEQGARQLCETVNELSRQLGMGRKVREEDFTDYIRAAVCAAKEGV